VVKTVSTIERAVVPAFSMFVDDTAGYWDSQIDIVPK
jgi:hypothetical protein